DADMCVMFAHRVAHLLQMNRATSVIDVNSVRVDPKGHHFSPQLFEHFGANPIGRSVGAVDHNLETFERDFTGHARFQKDQVTTDRIVNPRGFANVRTGSTKLAQASVVEDKLLDPSLSLVLQLVALTGKELDAVILKWVMRGR